MKKIISLVIAICIGVVCYAGEKVKLEFNLKKGETYYYQTNSELIMQQTYAGQTMNINMIINSRLAYKVIDIRDTIYDIQAVYEKLSMKMDAPMANIEMNSEKNDETDIFSSIAAAITEKPFSLKISKQGNVLEIKGLQDIFTNMFDQMPEISEAQKQQFKDQLSQSYGEKAFIGNFKAVLSIYPKKAVSKNESWQSNAQTELSGMAMDTKTTYTLTTLKAETAQIKGNAVMEMGNSNNTTGIEGMNVKYNLQGTNTSDIEIDRKTGWFKVGTISQEVAGSIEMGEKGDSNYTSIPMSIKMKTIITGK